MLSANKVQNIFNIWPCLTFSKHVSARVTTIIRSCTFFKLHQLHLFVLGGKIVTVGWGLRSVGGLEWILSNYFGWFLFISSRCMHHCTQTQKSSHSSLWTVLISLHAFVCTDGIDFEDVPNGSCRLCKIWDWSAVWLFAWKWTIFIRKDETAHCAVRYLHPWRQWCGAAPHCSTAALQRIDQLWRSFERISRLLLWWMDLIWVMISVRTRTLVRGVSSLWHSCQQKLD